LQGVGSPFGGHKPGGREIECIPVQREAGAPVMVTVHTQDGDMTSLLEPGDSDTPARAMAVAGATACRC